VTRISFYTLLEGDSEQLYLTACRITAKAYTSGSKTVILVADEEKAKELDDYLWEYPKDRFLPHGRFSAKPNPNLRTIIFCLDDPLPTLDLLVNLTDVIPDNFSEFDRIVEFVTVSNREEARIKYRRYQKSGCGSLETFKA